MRPGRSAGERKLFVHPAIRTYREPLYRRLGDEGFHFLWSSINAPGTHAGEETARILSDFPYPYFQARELQRGPVTNLSVDLLRVFKYDLVIFSSMTSVPFLLCAERLKRKGKRVLLFEETWRYQHEVPRYQKLLPLVTRRVQNAVDAFIPAGSAAKQMFIDEFKIPRDRLFPAYNTTVDLSQQPDSPEARIRISRLVRDATGGRRAVLYLGRLVAYKGLDVLIRAMRETPEDACLIVVGGGPFETECRQLANDLGLNDRVRFLPGCLSHEARYFYEEATVFVLPTRFRLQDAVNCESWGFTLNEAMSLGVPVIATNAVGAAFDLIRDGETGMLATENDPSSLAAKLQLLLQNNDLRVQIGRQGREHLRLQCNYQQSFQAFQDAIAFARSQPARGGRS